MRRFDGDGDVQRTISSTAVGSSARSDRSTANWIGMLGHRQQSAATALRVVSAPALNSRLKNRYNSIPRRRSPQSSRLALATTDSMSSVGAARFDAMSS